MNSTFLAYVINFLGVHCVYELGQYSWHCPLLSYTSFNPSFTDSSLYLPIYNVNNLNTLSFILDINILIFNNLSIFPLKSYITQQISENFFAEKMKMIICHRI